MALILASLAPQGRALAQTAGQITPPSLAPPQQAAPGRISIPETSGQAAPPGADRLSVRVGRIAVEGGLPAMAGATAAITEPLAGQTVTAAALFAAARQIEEAYARAGLVLARVVLPPQELADGGTLRLLVIDGFVERVDTNALPSAIRGRIAALLAPLVGARGLTMAEIERRLLLAGDTPGTTLRSTIAAGDAGGGSVLVIEARHQLVGGYLSFDNSSSDALGRYTTGLGLDVNSALGLGEQIYFRASGNLSGGENGFLEDRPRNRLLAGGFILPLGTDGLTLNIEATQARATPRPVPGFIAFTSEFTRISTRLRYPVIRGRDRTLNAELAFDVQEEKLDAVAPFEAPLSLDQLRIARAAADGFQVLPWGGVLSGRLIGSAGLDALGARSPDAGNTLPLSRQGASADFQKAELSLRYDQPLHRHLALQVQLRAQTAFGQALPRSEQIGLTGASALSSFDSGLFQGDDGYALRGEIQAPFTLTESTASLVAGLSPYLFGAFGEVTANKPSAQERRGVRGVAYGVGVRLAGAPVASNAGLSVTLEYGRQERSDDAASGDRVTLIAQLRF